MIPNEIQNATVPFSREEEEGDRAAGEEVLGTRVLTVNECADKKDGRASKLWHKEIERDR